MFCVSFRKWCLFSYTSVDSFTFLFALLDQIGQSHTSCSVKTLRQFQLCVSFRCLTFSLVGLTGSFKWKSNGKISSDIFICLSKTNLILSILHTSFFYLGRLHLSCSDSSVLLHPALSCSCSLSLFPSHSLPTFRSLWGCAEGEDPLQQKRQCSDPAV